MALVKINFTQNRLERLETDKKAYSVADSDVIGLRCKVYPTGNKVLLIYKKPRGSKSPVTVKICNLNDMLLDDIRNEARAILTEMSKGINPNQIRKAAQAKVKAEGETLRQVLDEYMDTDELKPSTKRFYRYQIGKHFKQYLDLPLHVLGNAELLRKLKKEIIGNGPAAANNSMRILRALFNYKYHLLSEMRADQETLIKYTWPIKSDSKSRSGRFWSKEDSRTNFIDPADLKKWWIATEKLSTDFTGHGDRARDYLQFVLLTGLRRREATGLQFANINYQSRKFKVLDTKNHSDLELPMSSHVETILKRRKASGDTKPFGFDETKFFVEFVRNESGLHFTIHDLRRSFISYANSLDIGVYSIKKLVNHRNKADVTENYSQVTVEQLRKPAQMICDYILSLAGVAENNVVPLKEVAHEK